MGHGKDSGFCSYYDGAIGCFLKGREVIIIIYFIKAHSKCSLEDRLK